MCNVQCAHTHTHTQVVKAPARSLEGPGFDSQSSPLFLGYPRELAYWITTCATFGRTDRLALSLHQNCLRPRLLKYMAVAGDLQGSTLCTPIGVPATTTVLPPDDVAKWLWRQLAVWKVLGSIPSRQSLFLGYPRELAYWM